MVQLFFTTIIRKYSAKSNATVSTFQHISRNSSAGPVNPVREGVAMEFPVQSTYSGCAKLRPCELHLTARSGIHGRSVVGSSKQGGEMSRGFVCSLDIAPGPIQPCSVFAILVPAAFPKNISIEARELHEGKPLGLLSHLMVIQLPL